MGTSTAGARWVGPGILLVLGTAILSGFTTFLNGFAVQGTSSDAFVTVRNLATVGLLVPVALLAARGRSGEGLVRSDLLQLVLIGLVGGAVPFLLFFHGLQLASAAGGAALASFVYRTLFLFAAVFGIVVLRERFYPRYVLAAGALLLGNYLLLSWRSSLLTDGTLYVLGATVLWAVEYTLSKRLLGHLPSTTVGLGRMGFGAAFLAAYLALTAQWTAVTHFSGGQWLWVLLSALLLSAFVTLWYAGLARVDLTVATSVLVLGFPVTWALTTFASSQALSLAQVVGATVVLLGAGVAIGRSSLRASWETLARPRPDA